MKCKECKSFSKRKGDKHGWCMKRRCATWTSESCSRFSPKENKGTVQYEVKPINVFPLT